MSAIVVLVLIVAAIVLGRSSFLTIEQRKANRSFVLFLGGAGLIVAAVVMLAQGAGWVADHLNPYVAPYVDRLIGPP